VLTDEMLIERIPLQWGKSLVIFGFPISRKQQSGKKVCDMKNNLSMKQIQVHKESKTTLSIFPF